MLGTIIGLASGALGGNVAGSLMKNASMGTLWNSVAGIAGGGIGATILGMIGLGGGGESAMSAMGILSNVGGGLVGGGVVMTVIGMIKKAMAK